MATSLSKPALITSGLLLAGAFATILLLKPDKPAMHIYSIGEQGLAEADGADKDYLDQTVVARISGYEVTAGEVDRALNQLPPYQRYYYSSPEQVQVFLQNYAMFLLLANQGAERGIQNDPYVRYVTEEALVEHYKQVFLAEAVKASDVTDAEVQEYLKSHREKLLERAHGDRSDSELATAAKAAIMEARRNRLWEEHLAELR